MAIETEIKNQLRNCAKYPAECGNCARYFKDKDQNRCRRGLLLMAANKIDDLEEEIKNLRLQVYRAKAGKETEK